MRAGRRGTHRRPSDAETYPRPLDASVSELTARERDDELRKMRFKKDKIGREVYA